LGSRSPPHPKLAFLAEMILDLAAEVGPEYTKAGHIPLRGTFRMVAGPLCRPPVHSYRPLSGIGRARSRQRDPEGRESIIFHSCITEYNLTFYFQNSDVRRCIGRLAGASSRPSPLGYAAHLFCSPFVACETRFGIKISTTVSFNVITSIGVMLELLDER
jgi:hypothetical protein